MKNRNLLSFILGMLTVSFFLPLIEDASSLLGTWFQALLITPTKVVTKGNKDIQEMIGEPEEEVHTHCFGFQLPPDDEEEFEDDF